jgi:hypothetical protein
MDDDKKICPFCGAEINKAAKKCRFCNNWIDEEIKCPYCAETIKASAKKCRFCGEWLDKNSVEEKKSDSVTKEEKSQESIDEEEIDKPKFEIQMSNKTKLIICLSGVAIILISFIIGFITYIPSCDNKNIKSKLKEYLTSNYDDIESIILVQGSTNKLKRIEKGYSCSISATLDDTPTRIEYSYKKVALNEYDINAKFVLPNCFDSSVKELLSDLIKKYDYYSIKDNTADVYTTNESQNNFDKDSTTYSCSADATLNSKPGKAYLLNSWGYDEASRTINCKVDYKTFFCKNGYTTCVGLSDIYACEYKD